MSRAGYLYNVQAKELYSLNYFQVPELLPAASPLAGTAGMLRQGIEGEGRSMGLPGTALASPLFPCCDRLGGVASWPALHRRSWTGSLMA